MTKEEESGAFGSQSEECKVLSLIRYFKLIQ